MDSEKILKRKRHLADLYQNFQESEDPELYNINDVKKVFSEQSEFSLKSTVNTSKLKIKIQQRKNRVQKFKGNMNCSEVMQKNTELIVNNDLSLPISSQVIQENTELVPDTDTSPPQLSEMLFTNGLAKLEATQTETLVNEKLCDVISIKNTSCNNSQIKTYKLNDDQMLVVIPEGQSLYFEGYLHLQSIIGHTDVFGYTLNNQKVVVVSVRTHLIFKIESVTGEVLINNSKDILKRSGIDDDLTEEIFTEYKNEAVCVVKVSRDTSNLKSVAELSCAINLVGKKSNGKALFGSTEIWKETVDAIPFVLSEKTLSKGVSQVDQSWDECATQLCTHIKKFKKICVMICGGIGLGKSSLLRYLANRLLSFQKVTQVAVLDLDPGQPELSVPGTLSLTVFTTPLLAPPFAHVHNMNIISRKQVYYGSLGVNIALHRYYAAVKSMLSDVRKLRCPVLVNTMGFVDLSATDLIVDFVRWIQPTHVVNIRSRVPTNNFKFDFTASVVNSFQYGAKTSASSPVNFVTIQFTSVSEKLRIRNFHRKNLRDMTLIASFSSVFRDTISSNSTIDAHQFKWRDVVVFNPIFPHWRSPAEIIHNFVALCRVGNEHLVHDNGFGFKGIRRDTTWAEKCEFFGYGILVENDVDSEIMHILTPCDKVDKVNAIINSDIFLPPELQEIFCSEFKEQTLRAEQEVAHKSERIIKKFRASSN